MKFFAVVVAVMAVGAVSADLFGPLDLTCSVCEKLVSTVRAHATEREDIIKERLDAACVLSGFLREQCRGIVDEYFPRIMAEMKDESLTNKQICQRVQLCKGLDQIIDEIKEIPAQLQGKVCETCTQLVGTARQFASENEETIKEKLNSVCGRLGPFAAKCNEVVNEYYPTIIEHITNGDLSDEQICQQIRLCPKLQSFSRTSVPEVVAGKVCDVCQMLVLAVRQFATEHETTIKSKLHLICAKLGNSNEEKCNELVDKHFPEIMKHVKNAELSNEQICKKVGICKDRAEIVQDVSALKCQVCVRIIDFARDLTPAPEAEMEQTLKDSVCGRLGPLKGQCVDIVDKYFPIIYEFLRGDETAQQICGRVRLCHQADSYLYA